MGMYDCMLYEQVKCFPVPYISDGTLWESSGSLKYYKKGQKVSYRTGWYNYTKNFNILVLNSFWEYPEPDTVIIIRDGHLKDVKDLVDTTGKDWEGMERCINRYGDWLRIKTKEDAMDYIEQFRLCYLEQIRYRKECMPVNKKLEELFFGIGQLSEEEKKERLSVYDRLKPNAKIEQKTYEAHMEGFREKTVSKYKKDVKPARVERKELLGSYRNGIRWLKKKIEREPEKEKKENYQNRLSECQKKYETWKIRTNKKGPLGSFFINFNIVLKKIQFSLLHF